MLDTIDEKLSKDMIKKFHFILKNGTLTDEEKAWVNVGDYKTKKNFVGTLTTSLPSKVVSDMKRLLVWYNGISKKTFEDIIEFHVRFESIHPFQDGNDYLRQKVTYLQKYL